MSKEKTIYPLYRKYINNKSFFKVTAPEKFEEIQVLGSKTTLHFFNTKILPDRNYIYDLTFNYKKNWIDCTEEEYESLKESASISLD